MNNDIIKGVGGDTHILNRPDEAALVRWELCVHELSKVLSDFEFLSSQVGPSKGKKHHEDTKAFREAFINDVRIVTKVFTCNPFEETSLTNITNTSISFDTEVTENIKNNNMVLGEGQFRIFWNTRLVQVKIPIDESLKSNNLKLPGTKVKSNEKEKDPTLATAMTVKLRSAYLFRAEQVKELFKHECFGIAQSISDGRYNLYHGTKSEITKRFEESEKRITNISTKKCHWHRTIGHYKSKG